jgi:hypothetical protein
MWIRWIRIYNTALHKADIKKAVVEPPQIVYDCCKLSSADRRIFLSIASAVSCNSLSTEMEVR